MRIYNTLSGAVEAFVPVHNPVRMYVCGVTPYDTTHLGHAFCYVVFDVLLRLVEYHGTPVRYVQNVTDVDDPLFERSRATGEPWQALGKRQVEQFVNDMTAMNARPVAVRPYVSTEIDGMVTMIQQLETSGRTYRIGDRLYFRVTTLPEYGVLGAVTPEYQIQRSIETGNDPELPGKEHPLDFLLWRPSEDDEPSWPSPWGPGRPGWHIECSAMALRHLGEQIDIHGGGQDLIFPHHASEIAQSEAYTGKAPFSRYWLHVGLVRLDGVKMSKSLGNLVFTRDLLKVYDPDAIRLYLMSHHYRDGWDYSEDALKAKARLVERLRAVVADPAAETTAARDLRIAAIAALDDDLNTPLAIKLLESLADLGAAGADGVNEVGRIFGLKLAGAQ